jgi:hypothetical protein
MNRLLERNESSFIQGTMEGCKNVSLLFYLAYDISTRLIIFNIRFPENRTIIQAVIPLYNAVVRVETSYSDASDIISELIPAEDHSSV